MRKIVIITLVVMAAGIAPHVLAQGFVALDATIPGLTDLPPTEAGLAPFFNNLYKYLIGIAAILAIIQLIWGGLEISTQDSVSKNKDGKERIREALFGLLLVLSPVLVFSIINPSILNLSINLKPIDLTTAPVQNTGQQRTTAQVAEDAARQGRIVPTTSSNEMQTTYTSCTPETCNAVRDACLANNSIRNTGDAQVVCLTSSGDVDPSGRTDRFYQSYSCKSGENLAVQCIQFTGTSPTP